jgi:hypothetical protein
VCDAEHYGGNAEKCIAYHGKRLQILKSLERLNCPTLGAKSTWSEHVGVTLSLIEQMKKCPNGQIDFLEEMERARQSEIDRLEGRGR